MFSRVAHLVPCGRWLCLDDDFDEARASQEALWPLVLAHHLLARPGAHINFLWCRSMYRRRG